MLNTLSYRDIKKTILESSETRIVLWEMCYLPISCFGFKTHIKQIYSDNKQFGIGLIFTVFKSDNTYYKLVQTSEKLSGQDLNILKLEPELLPKKYSAGAINFWFFRELPIVVYRGKFSFEDFEKVKIENNIIYTRKKSGIWNQQSNKKILTFDMECEPKTSIKSYIPIISYHEVYSASPEGIDLLEKSIQNIKI